MGDVRIGLPLRAVGDHHADMTRRATPSLLPSRISARVQQPRRPGRRFAPPRR